MLKPALTGARPQPFLSSSPVAMNFHASPAMFLSSELTDNLNFLRVFDSIIFTSFSSRLLLFEHF